MKCFFLAFACLFCCFVSYGQDLAVFPDFSKSKSLKIRWKKDLKVDVTFTQNWDYALGVEQKQDGRAGLADGGFGPARCYQMLDEQGLVLPDSANVFYHLLDTTHYYYTAQISSNEQEFAGANYLYVNRMEEGVLYAHSAVGVATHSFVELRIEGATIQALSRTNSIVLDGDTCYPLVRGRFLLEKKAYQNGMLKGKGRLYFDGKDADGNAIYWDLLILVKIRE